MNNNLIKEMKYSYKDISIKPAILSTVEHRSECNPYDDKGLLPLFTAPMDSVVGLGNLEEWEKNKIHAIVPRTITLEERSKISMNTPLTWVAYSLSEFEELFCLEKFPAPAHVLIDVANGHMLKIYELVEKAKSLTPDLVVMVGNIANPETYGIANQAGVDYVRVGIGGGKGCFVKGTMILMADGTEKPIEEVRVGDEVITHRQHPMKVTEITNKVPEPGSVVQVIADLHTGLNEKETMTVTCTKDHEFCYISKKQMESCRQAAEAIRAREPKAMVSYRYEFEWIKAEELLNQCDETLTVFNKERTRVTYAVNPAIVTSELFNDIVEVYDLTVEEDHSYVANGFVVHNCITSSNTAIHYPMASLVHEMNEVRKKMQGKGIQTKTRIVADGGIRGYSDVIKALALGADYVMIGSVFTKMIESAAPMQIRWVNGEYSDIWFDVNDIDHYNPNNIHYEDGKFYKVSSSGIKDEVKFRKEFYGMASKKGQIAMNGKVTKTAEGLSTYLPVEYTMSAWVENMTDYLKSAMSYTGSRTLEEFSKNAEVIVLSPEAVGSINK